MTESQFREWYRIRSLATTEGMSRGPRNPQAGAGRKSRFCGMRVRAAPARFQGADGFLVDMIIDCNVRLRSGVLNFFRIAWGDAMGLSATP